MKPSRSPRFQASTCASRTPRTAAARRRRRRTPRRPRRRRTSAGLTRSSPRPHVLDDERRGRERAPTHTATRARATRAHVGAARLPAGPPKACITPRTPAAPKATRHEAREACSRARAPSGRRPEGRHEAADASDSRAHSATASARPPARRPRRRACRRRATAPTEARGAAAATRRAARQSPRRSGGRVASRALQRPPRP